MELIKNLGFIAEKNDDLYEIEGIASVEMVDRDGDIIYIDNMEIDSFKKNPTVFLQHKKSEIGAGVGIVTDLWKGVDAQGRKALYFKAQLDKEDPVVQKVYSKLKKGISKGISIGFTPTEYKANHYGGFDVTKSILSEISIVNVGANQGAYITSVKSLVKDNTPSSFKLSEDDIKAIATEVVSMLDEREAKKQESAVEEEHIQQEEEKELENEDTILINGEYVKIIK